MSKSANELRELYPFLHGDKKDFEQERLTLLAAVNQKSAESLRQNEQFFATSGESVVEVAQLIALVYRRGGRMFAMGNGGSSCDAAHFAVEFQHPVTTGRPALPAVNLSMDTAMISAVANDVGFKQIFARQLEALAQPEDGLIGFSTSGNAENLLEGFRRAKEIGLSTIGMAGGDGGLMRSSANVDRCLVVETDSIHRVQEVHVTIYHIIWDLVHTLLADHRGKLGAAVR